MKRLDDLHYHISTTHREIQNKTLKLIPSTSVTTHSYSLCPSHSCTIFIPSSPSVPETRGVHKSVQIHNIMIILHGWEGKGKEMCPYSRVDTCLIAGSSSSCLNEPSGLQTQFCAKFLGLTFSFGEEIMERLKATLYK